MRNVIYCTHFVPANNLLFTTAIFSILYSAAFFHGMEIYGISQLRSTLGSTMLSPKASLSYTSEGQLVCFHAKGMLAGS